MDIIFAARIAYTTLYYKLAAREEMEPARIGR